MKSKTDIIRATIAAAFAVCLAAGPSAKADLLYQQPFDMTGAAYSSQNDTSGGNGAFATVYDNFTLGSDSNINNVTWTGEFFNPPSHGDITAFTVSFWADSGAQPGALLSSFSIGGNANETSLGDFGGFPTYSYSLDLGSDFATLAGTQYWVSIVPDLGFPPQWGVSGGTGGDGIAYQDFFGTRSQLQADLAFCLNGTSGGRVPDAGDTAMLLGGALVLLGVLRQRFGGKSLAN